MSSRQSRAHRGVAYTGEDIKTGSPFLEEQQRSSWLSKKGKGKYRYTTVLLKRLRGLPQVSSLCIEKTESTQVSSCSPVEGNGIASPPNSTELGRCETTAGNAGSRYPGSALFFLCQGSIDSTARFARRDWEIARYWRRLHVHAHEVVVGLQIKEPKRGAPNTMEHGATDSLLQDTESMLYAAGRS